jgi:hypothetical protein
MKKTMRSIAAVTILLSSSAIAQTAPTVQTASLKLEDTTFQLGQYTELSAACDSCTDAGAFTPLVTPLEVTCPARRGESCTFAVHVDAAMRATDGSVGAFQYVGDAQTTVLPMPVVASQTGGFYMWTLNGTGDQVVSASTTFVALVKNTKDNQKHHVEIDLGCFSRGGPGPCNVQALGLFEQGSLFGSPVTVTTQVFRERKRDDKDMD